MPWSAEARYYVGSDYLGTPKVVTDNTGNIMRQIEYDSWGIKTADTNPGFDLSGGLRRRDPRTSH